MSSGKPKVIFHYEKSADYKNYHIDGVYGGALPSSNISLETFIEKVAVPKKSVYKIDGTKPTEIEKEEDKLVREVQSGFTMSLNVAKSLRDWLDNRIAAVEEGIAKTHKK